VSAPDVSPLLKQADLLTELYVERANDIEADPELARDGTFDAAGVLRQSADLIRRLAEALRVESPPPAGPWKAQPSNATQPWRVWAPQRKVLSDLSREEALAVRDALNALGASKGTPE